MASSGRLLALEGIDGCGKSTQASVLANTLGAVLTHEPGATELGRSLRGLLLDPGQPAPRERTEALLMAADRAEHVDRVVTPTLLEGRWVVTDRYSGSTLAYQGWGRGLDIEGLRRLVEFATGGLDADLSVLVDVGLDVARRRLGGVSRDRMEGLDAEFFDRVRQGFHAQAEADPRHWAVVDGNRDVVSVAGDVAAAVRDRLGWPEAQPGPRQ